MKFGRGYKNMQAARRVFAFRPVKDVYGYWLWLEVVIYDPKDGTYREVPNDKVRGCATTEPREEN